jgi:hypothetical protein
VAHSSTNTDYLTRANLWSTELKDIQQFDLLGTQYVRMLDFPDGDTLNIPSIGQLEVQDYAENMPVRYTAMDTGNFTFTITEYKSSAVYITQKARQDLFYASQLESQFVPKMARSIAEDMEAFTLAIGPDGQTASNANTINGASHRWIGSGASETIDVVDFAKALYSLQKAGYPSTNLIAIVDPSVEYKLNTLTNLTNVSNNPHWEGIITTGHRTGMRFVKNIYGFDVYVSHFLKSGLTDSISGLTAGAGVANLFFSATPDVLPFVGAIRQAPKVDASYNKDFQREEYVTTCRYGMKLFRPDNLVVVITDTDQVF